MPQHPHRTLATIACCVFSAATIAQVHNDREDREQRSPVKREHTDRPQLPGDAAGATLPAMFPAEFRTIDGSFNNGANPLWGAAATPFTRLLPPAYDDGASVPAGIARPSARAVSNSVLAQDGADYQNQLGLSDYMWQWGQFLDHDFAETPISSPAEPFDILVPVGDPWFDPTSLGTVTIPLDRSAYSNEGGVREQLNEITAFVDASQVYGSEEHRAEELRTLDGTGMLKTSDGNLLPFNTSGLANAPTALDPTFFVAGDIRANEQVGLTAMHTLFVREHNRIAVQIASNNPAMDGDSIYEHARAIVAAEMQAITYNEFLPRLLGPGALPPYNGYRPHVNPSISNEFATAAYRVGHTMLSTQILRIDANGDETAAGHLDLAAAFFVPQETIDHGIEPVLRGLAAQRAQNIDAYVIDDIRNFLFGAPGSGGFDLASLNIQRGRDHGLPSYNDLRELFGAGRAMSFAQVTPDTVMQDRLADAYTSVDDIDAWVGLLAEPHHPGAFVGTTLRGILRDQFLRLRDGDRFWYQSYLPPPLVNRVNQTSLADIIRANTSIGAELQNDVFRVRLQCPADLNGDGAVNSNDLSEMLASWGGAGAADLDRNGVTDDADLAVLLAAWGPCN